MAVIQHWPLYLLDIKNVVFHGVLKEEVYIEQALGIVAVGKCGLIYNCVDLSIVLKQYLKHVFRISL